MFLASHQSKPDPKEKTLLPLTAACAAARLTALRLAISTAIWW